MAVSIRGQPNIVTARHGDRKQATQRMRARAGRFPFEGADMSSKPSKRYVLHPGHVRSAYDGDTHFIDGRDLCALYGVDPRECVSWYPGMRPLVGAVHLYPRDDRRYELAAESAA
jgi:hypothetical protein